MRAVNDIFYVVYFELGKKIFLGNALNPSNYNKLFIYFFFYSMNLNFTTPIL